MTPMAPPHPPAPTLGPGPPRLAPAVAGDIAPWRRRLDRAVVGTVEAGLRWSFRHWLALANLGVALTLLGALAAPLLAAAGLASVAGAIHTLYLLLCPQRPSHSWFLLGHQLALEHREMAIFTAQLVAGLAFGALRARTTWRLDWRLFLLASLPMAWDVLSQQLGVRDSDWTARSWTGALFGAAFVLWFYPLLEHGFRARRVQRGFAEPTLDMPGEPAAGR